MPKKIAIVNDERDFVDMVTILLEDEGYDVQASGEGHAALRLIQELKPDLVLLDIRMSGLTGWEILEQMKKDSGLASTKVLVTSGAVEEVGAASAELRKSGHDYIALPFDLDEFIRKVKAMIGEP
ncbi:MAG: response regulator [Chloroflexota bacterium]